LIKGDFVLKKAISVFLALFMLLSAVPLQCFAENAVPVSIEIVKKPKRPFILGVDDKYRNYVMEYDEAADEWIDTGIWYYNAPTYGMELKVNKSDGTSEIITNGFANTDFSMMFKFIFSCRIYENPVNGGTVTASVETSEYWKGEKLRATFTMDVVDRYVDSIEVLSAPDFQSYKGFKDYTLEGMKLKINYADSTSDIHTFAPFWDGSQSILNGELITANCNADETFSGEHLALSLSYLDCSAEYELLLYENPYTAIKITDFDYKTDEYNDFNFSSLTVKVTKNDGSSQAVVFHDFDVTGGEETAIAAGKIDGHSLFIKCDYYAKSRHGISVTFLNVSDETEVDSRTLFDKILEKVMNFITDFLFNKLYNAMNRLF